MKTIILSAIILLSFTSDWTVPASAVKMKNPIEVSKENTETGKELWSKYCKSCHGGKGLGDGTKASKLDTKIISFASKEFQGQTDGSLFFKTSKGRDEMPGFEDKLDKEETWTLVNYMRGME